VIFESDIEEKLVRGIEKRGGLCLKFGMDGWPDRIVILSGQVIWVELKRPTGEVAKLQKWRAAQLKKLGQRVEIPKNKEDVQQFLDSL
jgi:hypothetical protein